MTTGSIHRKTTIHNVHTPSNRASKHIRNKAHSTEKENKQINTIVKEFYILL